MPYACPHGWSGFAIGLRVKKQTNVAHPTELETGTAVERVRRIRGNTRGSD